MACTSLCLWARAIYKYNDVAQTIAPKKAKLAEAEGQLNAAQKVLGEKRAALAAVVAKVAQASSIVLVWGQHQLAPDIISYCSSRPSTRLRSPSVRS